LNKKQEYIIRLASQKNQIKNKIYQFWYDVYYCEMGRNRKYVNFNKKILIDEFEPNSDCLYVENNNTIIATSRIITNDIFLGYYYNFYALDLFSKESYCVVTKYMIDQSNRNGSLGYILALATVEYCKKRGIKWIIIDCSPIRYDYFAKLGFEEHLGLAYSPEYGEVKIMKFDVFKDTQCPLNNPLMIKKYKQQFRF
jgi:hypothetical protein